MNIKTKFYLVGDAINGLLTDSEGNVFKPFQTFIRHMKKRRYATSTINNYGEHVVRFLNYVYEAFEQFETLDRASLIAIVDSYPLYLLHGIDVEDEIAKPIAINHKKTHKSSVGSLSVVDAAISYFIKLGELEQYNEFDQKVTPLFEAVVRDVNQYELAKMKQNSMFAGVLSSRLTSKQRVNSGILGQYKRKGSNKTVTTRSVDLDKIVALIESANNLRDKAFYSLLAATGGRTHEVLQVTRDDINVTERTVKFVDPFSDKKRLDTLSQDEYKALAWKGRATELTFMIEPFKTMFFNYFEQYRREDRISTVNHDFVFQTYVTGSDDIRAGRPYFASDRSSRIKQFKKAAQKAGIDDLFGISPHSLRHTYGIYTLNYLPLPNDKFGLEMPFVKVLMGHSSISSTEVYAKKKDDLVEALVSYANELVFNENIINLAEVRKRYHQKEIENIETEIARIEEAA